VSSFRHSVDDWLGQILVADLYLRLSPVAGSGDLVPADQARLAAVQGIDHLSFGKTIPFLLAPERPPMALVVRGEDPADLLRRVPVIGAVVDVGGEPSVLLSEPAARLLGLGPGATLDLPLGGTLRPFRVAGLWRDYSRQFGAVAIDRATYRAATGDEGANEVAVWAQPGIDPAVLERALRAALPEAVNSRAEIAWAARLRAIALDLFDRSFILTYAIEAIAMLVGMAGVASTMSAQTFARAKEFGMLRHLGVRRGEIAGLLLIEGGALGLAGVLCGIGLGGLMGMVLTDVVNPQSFHWTMDTVWPLRLMAAVGTALVLASALAARLAGRAALTEGPLLAVREDF
jgi:putative ABC transport system permease protein